jgi:sigma54-dependent transcription regulator
MLKKGDGRWDRCLIGPNNPESPVLITGETGVGKDVIASAIGYHTKSKPFVAVDCGAISENLAESEFFGHVKGSFTGAETNKQGKFQLANNGDLFPLNHPETGYPDWSYLQKISQYLFAMLH